ncbi:MAG TPA: hypothetical protein VKK79_17090 [Candidatus Lokiarchaeia archaeon]|nr:hypothetical protein [Candidatus Lokiarchaeia archaeon]
MHQTADNESDGEERENTSQEDQESLAPESKPLKDPHNLVIPQPVEGQKSVKVSAAVYKSIVLYASRYANPSILREEWKEIYGILIGYLDKENGQVVVTECEPLTFGESTDVQLQAIHYTQIAAIQDKLDAEGDKFLVGWFHSHPGLSLFFSYVDLLNQLNFQAANPDFIGLVFDHALLEDKTIQDRPLGFEIFRLTDSMMSMDAPEFEMNYNQVAWEIEGMNEYFFANVLAELSAKYAAGKPLEESYGEKIGIRSPGTKSPAIRGSPSKGVSDQTDATLTPLTDLTSKMAQPPKDPIELLTWEGQQAFEHDDAFSGIEKYKKAIDILKKGKKDPQLMTRLGEVAEFCFRSDHLNLTIDFTRDLLNLAEKNGSFVHMGVAHYLRGKALLKKGGQPQSGLEHLEQAIISFDKCGEWAGAGVCNILMGDHSRAAEENFSAALYYIEAIKEFKKVSVEGTPARSLPGIPKDDPDAKLPDLIALVENLTEQIPDPGERKKIELDLEKLK